jgi:hypothetical protein
MEATKEDETNAEIERLKKESAIMVKKLKSLEKQENELRIQNQILAREALLNGFPVEMLENVAVKRRKSSAKKSEINAD